MVRQRAEETDATAKQRELMSYQEIASQHAEAVELLDGIIRPYEVVNGKVSYPLFTDGFYRDPEEYRRRWQKERDWHARMAEKYDYAARHPRLPVEPDPPEPH
jgi:hypothetical protein